MDLTPPQCRKYRLDACQVEWLTQTLHGPAKRQRGKANSTNAWQCLDGGVQ